MQGCDLMNKKVFDDRTDETLFTGTENECIEFINKYLAKNRDDINHIWITNNENLYSMIRENLGLKQGE